MWKRERARFVGRWLQAEESGLRGGGCPRSRSCARTERVAWGALEPQLSRFLGVGGGTRGPHDQVWRLPHQAPPESRPPPSLPPQVACQVTPSAGSSKSRRQPAGAAVCRLCHALLSWASLAFLGLREGTGSPGPHCPWCGTKARRWLSPSSCGWGQVETRGVDRA